ncbi:MULTISPECIES: carbon storage regulator CsrA [Brevibacillus]|uniref:carbon storage regulator CsrA n=1 Tax=Brevibacillus TaxID=55080 RepID=UPI000F0A09F2|nr:MULTISPECIES: carbon storage regulator CsrA [Brevibacillus]MDR7317980.1 carbon storage regulator [Brevibacillus nitrificans]MEC2130559.1 carbon storage regulator CsrA [Brevibacillus centrosporus]RNB68839.1 carbon storage regulator [Brevibacillus centrosporus]GED33877.1 hypothetical protein BCE02nite_50180 [Brevibacillus centrosporus]
MLVLSRKVGQSLVIQEDIVLKVVSIDGENVKLGIEAPKHISIYRDEIYESIKSENKGAVLNQKEIDLQELATLLMQSKHAAEDQDA